MQSFIILRRTIENVKNILYYGYKNVSFALLNGSNVNKTIVLTRHEREWALWVKDMYCMIFLKDDIPSSS